MQDAIQGTPPSDAQPGPRPQTRALTRSHDRMLGGVAGGLADYFDVDPTIVRLGLVLAALVSGGIVVIGYIALWIIMPEAPSSTVSGVASGDAAAATTTAASANATPEQRRANGALILGVILVGVGAFALLDQFSMFHFFGWNMARIWWPSLLIALGLALVLARARD